MRALVVYRVDRSDRTNIGVVKKLIGIRNALQNCKCDTDYIIHDKKSIHLNEQPIVQRKPSNSLNYFKWSFYKNLKDQSLYHYDLYIIRYGISTPHFNTWLTSIKANNPSCKILIDMPTFPYKKEWTGLKGKILLLIDNWYRKGLYKNVDYMLHSGEEDMIFGIPTIKFSNGIDVHQFQKRAPNKNKGYQLIAVAKFHNWHGIDRLIKGLNDYVQSGKNNVQLSLVGSGPAVDDLKNLIAELNLEHIVSFKGVLTGRLLNDAFDDSDLGIGTLAMHRKGVKWDCSLKHREYTCRGLPFMMAGQDVDIEHQIHFLHTINADESNVDIGALISFMDRLDQGNIITEMRSYAISRLSWEVKLKALLKQIYLEEA